MKGLPRAVKDSLNKARESALLAVEVYNKPAVAFKAGGYITLMVIAWTALFHAVFFRRNTKPYYKRPNGRFQKVDGDFRHWELSECIANYFPAGIQDPIRMNLEFFIPLRNKIEHRSFPEIDATIFGECQAMLLNFDLMLEKEFGAKYCLRESLSFALQLFPSSRNLAEAVKRKPDASAVTQFVAQYRSTLSVDVIQSGRYAFKAFLIQVTNHNSHDALPIQFFHYDKLSEEQKTEVNRFATMVKIKEVPMGTIATLSANEVVNRVQKALGEPKVLRNNKERNKFTTDWHRRCWQKFKVRPATKSSKPDQTNKQFCFYDARHRDYGYTEEWVKFLIEKFRDGKEYDALYGGR